MVKGQGKNARDRALDYRTAGGLVLGAVGRERHSSRAQTVGSLFPVGRAAPEAKPRFPSKAQEAQATPLTGTSPSSRSVIPAWADNVGSTGA